MSTKGYCMYLRKSRADRDAEMHGEGETLARHEELLTSLSNKLNIKISKIYREIVSGETISARPEMMRLLSEVESGQWDGVLVVEIERLARGATIDQGIVAQAFQLSGTKIITPSKTYDPNNEFDQEYFEFGLFMSRREYKTINRRIQRGRVAAVNEGRYVGSTAPFGYNRVKIKNDKGWTLEPNPTQAEVVKLIFDLYVNGKRNDDGTRTTVGSTKICDVLDELNIKNTSNTAWSPSSIRDIIRNPVYAGKVRWGYDQTKKIPINGKIHEKRTRNKNYIMVDGLHPALVDDITFQKAQNLLASNTKARVTSTNDLKNPLAGIVFCKKCGRLMTRLSPTSKTPYSVLKCPNRFCDNISAPLYLIENKLLNALEIWLEKYEIDIKDKSSPMMSLPFDTSIDALKLELEELELQYNKTFDLLERGIYDDDTFLIRNKAIKRKINKNNAEIEKLCTQKKRAEKALALENSFVPNVKNIITGYNNIENADMKNQLLKSVIKKVDYLKTEKNTRGKRENDNFDIDLYPLIPYK